MSPPAATSPHEPSRPIDGTAANSEASHTGKHKKSGKSNGPKESKKNVARGMDCNLKNLYQGPRDSTHEWTWTAKYPKDVEEPAENSTTAGYAILVRNKKSFDPRKKLQIDSIVIQSPLLKEALEPVFAEYPGMFFPSLQYMYSIWSTCLWRSFVFLHMPHMLLIWPNL